MKPELKNFVLEQMNPGLQIVLIAAFEAESAAKALRCDYGTSCLPCSSVKSIYTTSAKF